MLVKKPLAKKYQLQGFSINLTLGYNRNGETSEPSSQSDGPT